MTNPSRMLAVQLLSGLSIWLDIFLTFSVPVYAWNASPSEIGFLALCLGIPSLILGPIAGILVDRSDIRKGIIIGAIARVITSASLAFAPNLYLFAALVALKSLANIIYFPCSAIMVKNLIAPHERIGYFSMASLFDQSGKILTPLLAGGLTLLIDSSYIFLVSASCVAVAIPILISLVRKVDHVENTRKINIKGIFADLASGITLFRELPFQLKLGLLYSLLTSLALSTYDPHLASFLSSLGYLPVVFSWIVSATAAGAVTAAILTKLLSRSPDALLLRAVALSIFSAALIGTVLIIKSAPSNQYVFFLAFWFANGFAYELLIISSSVILQSLCPGEVLGRISTTFRSIQLTCVIFGPSLGTLLITLHDRSTPFIFSASLSAITATIAIAFYRTQKADRHLKSDNA